MNREEIEKDRVKTYLKLSEEFNIDSDTIGHIFTKGIEYALSKQKQLPTDDKSMIYKMSEIEHKCTIGYDITEEEKKYFNDNYDSTLSYFKDIYEHWKYYTSKLS